MKKEIRKTVRFSETEWEQIEKNLEGKSFSDFTREVLLHGEIKISRVKKMDQDLIYEINRIGNNLNQIAKKANSNELAGIQLLAELVEIEKAIKNVC